MNESMFIKYITSRSIKIFYLKPLKLIDNALTEDEATIVNRTEQCDHLAMKSALGLLFKSDLRREKQDGGVFHVRDSIFVPQVLVKGENQDWMTICSSYASVFSFFPWVGANTFVSGRKEKAPKISKLNDRSIIVRNTVQSL